MTSLVIDQLMDQVDVLISELEELIDMAVPLELAHQLRDELEQMASGNDQPEED